jgi:hypothetical protein
LPRRRFDLDRETIRTGSKQEVASPRAFEKRALLVAEVKAALKLCRLARPLRAEEGYGRVGRDHRARIGAQ